MALIANVSFSKKIPVQGEQFSSQGYSLSLQTEITETEPGAIQSQLHQTFELVKQQVEHELANGNGRATALAVSTKSSTEPSPSRTSGKASNKQIKFLTDLCTQQGMSLTDLNAEIQERFGAPGLYDLDRKQASTLLDEMNKRRTAA